jgi:uncharacterized membrane protein (DUF373 family)
MPDPADEAAARPARPRGVAGTIWALEHAQDFVTVTVGVVLIALAAVLVVDGLATFFHTAARSVPSAATALLDQVLLVLILVEIVHTVVLSLRAHRLAAQPFIIVGLVAVIRRILFVLSSEVRVDTTELGLLILMLIAFVASFLAVSWFERREG